MPDNSRCNCHARRLIRVGYAPDAVRGMLCLQPSDPLWDDVQHYYDERKSHAAIKDQPPEDTEDNGHRQ